MSRFEQLPVAIIGAGPVGLAAAAHLTERDIAYVVLEAGQQVAANVRQWAHVRIFSPWRYNIDPAAQRLLKNHGWQQPDAEALPTGQELLENYLNPLADIPEIKKNLVLGTTVSAISRDGIDKMKSAGRENSPFLILARQKSDCCSRDLRLRARAVIDTSGTWQNPNPMGSSGIPADGESQVREHIYYGIPEVLGKDLQRYARKAVAVVGGGHSAIQVLLDLARLDREDQPSAIFWVIRSANFSGAYGDKINDALPARGALNSKVSGLIKEKRIVLKTAFHVQRVARHDGGLTLMAVDAAGIEDQIDGLDELVVATGSRPNLDMLRELRLEIDPALESVAAIGPLIDPNLHSCGTVPAHGERELRQPEPDFYIAGIKSYGRAPTFLMATGYEQVRSIVAALAGDRKAADDVNLSLPSTGVCTSDSLQEESSCCDSDTRQQAVEAEERGDHSVEQQACCTVEVDPAGVKNGGCC